MKYRLLKIVSILIALAVITGCSISEKQMKPAPAPEIYPGYLAGYLQTEMLPNSSTFIPPPPIEGSAELALDKEESLENLALNGTPRWLLATEDAELRFPKAAEAFSCAIKAPITEQDTPHLYRLLRRTLMDAGRATYSAKYMYKRPRPFIGNGEPICTPQKIERLKESGSYPSGHTAIGWAWALILAEIAPEHVNEIIARGWDFGESRKVCNVHWHSDIVAGRLVGAAVVARLHADPTFLADLEAAKAEFASVRKKGLKPTRDCQKEVEALTQK